MIYLIKEFENHRSSMRKSDVEKERSYTLILYLHEKKSLNKCTLQRVSLTYKHGMLINRTALRSTINGKRQSDVQGMYQSYKPRRNIIRRALFLEHTCISNEIDKNVTTRSHTFFLTIPNHGVINVWNTLFHPLPNSWLFFAIETTSNTLDKYSTSGEVDTSIARETRDVNYLEVKGLGLHS